MLSMDLLEPHQAQKETTQAFSKVSHALEAYGKLGAQSLAPPFKE